MIYRAIVAMKLRRAFGALNRGDHAPVLAAFGQPLAHSFFGRHALAGTRHDMPSVRAWYARLKKPSFQPPRQAFPIVWPILYADIAAVSALTASSADLSRRAIATRGPVGAALGLYPAWCAFATLLSTRIWQLNRDG